MPPIALILVLATAQPPSIDDFLSLRRVEAPAISPDGRLVAYAIRETNWDENAYETEIWIGDGSGKSRQLTNAPKSSTHPAWSPDGKWVAFLSARDGKRQLYRIAPDGGEAERLTNVENGVSNFEWSPSGALIAFTSGDPQTEAMKSREKRWGDIRLRDLDQSFTHLYVLDLATHAVRPLTSGNFVVGGFDWSPDSSKIAFDHAITSDLADIATSDISVVDVASAVRTALVTQDGLDFGPKWSPDGSRIAFGSVMDRPFYHYQNIFIAVVPASGGTPRNLTDGFDEKPELIAWTDAGILFTAAQHTWAYLFTLDPSTKQIARRAVRDQWAGTSFSPTRDGSQVAFIASTPTEFPEVYVAPVATMAARKVSDSGAQIASWPKHIREVVRWKSQDGTEIEGVLNKPADFQPGKKYPLLLVIHGGPSGVSRPAPYVSGGGYYPVDMFLAKGALVLQPNYRGSAGYGEKFRSLNVRNLGIGDAWDVLSGIDALVAQGIADNDRVGAMGWSQGGYISAFLTTKHSDRFKAVSVGAGPTNWLTYYGSSDIQSFTLQYLGATPWEDAKIYARTSPMTYIKNAKAPTLIQHGEEDSRVPLVNALELYRGLRDQNVPTQLSVFTGMGHGLTTPKSNRAAMEQNEEWFTRYIWK